MLTEQRQAEILRLLDQKGSVTLQELKVYFDTSESTIRRDLTQLDQRGDLVKVFGGAVKKESGITTREERVSFRMEQNQDAKIRIGRYAASLIEPNDFVYLDAGTTTASMIPFLTEKSAVYVTNAISHALQLADNGFRVLLIEGELKATTQAIVGEEAYACIQKYNFTKGFLGTNGINRKVGYTTPDINEAAIKRCALRRSEQAFVLCDSSKFSQVNPVTFGGFYDASVITEAYADESYQKEKNILIAE